MDDTIDEISLEEIKGARVLPGYHSKPDEEFLVRGDNPHTTAYSNPAFAPDAFDPGFSGGYDFSQNGGGRVNFESSDYDDLEPDYDTDLSEEDIENTRRKRPASAKRGRSGLWDVFQVSPNDTEDFCGEAFWESIRRVVKVITAIIMFVVVVSSAVISKLSLFLIVSHISDDARFDCTEGVRDCVRANRHGEWALPQYIQMRWVWGMFICVCGTYLFEFIRSVWVFCFKSVKYPQKTTVLVVLCQETCKALGVFIFTFIALPAFDVTRGVWLAFGVGVIPAFLKLLEKDPVADLNNLPPDDNMRNVDNNVQEAYNKMPKAGNSAKTKFKNLFKIFDALALLAQISVLVLWVVYDSLTEVSIPKCLLPVALTLTSVAWWENYVSANTPISSSGDRIKRLKKDISRCRVILTVYSSLWSIVVTFACLMIYFVIRDPDCVHVLFFQKDSGPECFGPVVNGTRFLHDDTSPVGNWIIGTWPTGNWTVVTFDVIARLGQDPFWIAILQVLSAGLCYTVSKTACKIMLQQISFSLPLLLATPVAFIFLSGVCFQSHQVQELVPGLSSMPSYLFWHCDVLGENMGFLPFISNYTTHYFMPVVIIWWLSILWLTWHIWKPKMERLAKTEKLFVRSLYCGVFLEQSMLLNRRRDEQSYRKLERDDQKRFPSVGSLRGIGGSNPLDTSHLRSDDTPMIYICATMWHESENEMIQVLKSIMRLDEDQCTRKLAMTTLVAEDADYYEFEAHIFFDDAFDAHTEEEFTYDVNGFVQMMVRVVDIAGRAVHKQNSMELPPPVKVPTPYGGRLEWTLPGGNKLVAHLKDKVKIRHKKRWSQVMYMYYFLGHQLMDLKTITTKQKQIRADNTFLLALDGDVDFNPSAIQLLVDRMKKDHSVGAACGRIHPIGAGPMVWYQKFEYAVSHWLQKATEHMFGCVLCSPGCFSLFRGSSLMDDNVMRKYTTTATEARHFVQYDQGEDRWLCTLLLQQGYRVEYCAASDAYTYAPEGFNEYFTQRRRWTPSTMANILDLLLDWKNVIRKNQNISCLYIMYQGFMMASSIVTPGTVFLLISGAINIAIPEISLMWSILLNFVPVFILFILCFVARNEIQLLYAAILSVLYSLVMMLVIVGLILQVVEDGLCSLTTYFFIFVVGTFFLAAFLHPQEIYCFIFGFLYFLAIPTMAMLMMIYSLCNLHVVSWGTREVKQAPKTEGAATAVEKKKTTGLLDNILSKIASSPTSESDYALSFGNLCKCLCCPRETNKHKTALEAISDRLEYIEGHLIDLKRGPDGDSDSESPTRGDIRFSEVADVFEGTGNKQNPLFKEKREPWRDELIDPFWIHDSSLGTGPIKHLDNVEISFWRQVQEKYLTPLSENTEDKKRVSDELLELRNKVCLFYFLLNAIYIVIIVAFEYIKSTKEGILTISAKCYANGTPYAEPLLIEPLSLIFMAVFGVLLFIQLLGMIFHRLSTFLHINASTKLSRNSSEQMKIKQNLKTVRELQQLQTWEDDETMSVVTGSSVSNKGGKLVRRLAKRHRKQPVAQGTLRGRFFSNVQKVMQYNNNNEFDVPFRGPSRLQNAVKLLREKPEVSKKIQQIIDCMKPDSAKYSKAKLLWLNAYKKVKAQNRRGKETGPSQMTNSRAQGRWKKLPRGHPRDDDDDGIPAGADALGFASASGQGRQLRSNNVTVQPTRPASIVPDYGSTEAVVNATDMYHNNNDSLY